MKTNNKFTAVIFGLATLLSFSSCEDFLDVDPPVGIVVQEDLFKDARYVRAAINGLYTENLLSNTVYNEDVPWVLSLVADESYHTSTSYDDLRYNAYTPTNSTIKWIWDGSYQSIFISNDLINNLPDVTVISEEEKEQAIGEARYFRAYSYFLLTYSFGDVPLVTSTDIINTTLQPSVPKETIVQFILNDLKLAETALVDSKNEKTKVTKAAVSALLARNYLYHEEWANAENKADEVITTSGAKLEDNLDNVFLRSSKEGIFQTSSSASWSSYIDRNRYASYTGNNSYFRLTEDLLNSFEEGDLRKEKWTTPKTASGVNFQHAYKYKRTTATSGGAAEDFISLRLTEQYLIRAEARAQQNKLTDAIADLNIIRKRAGLPDLSGTLTKAEVLLKVENERRHELFLEEGHRWWDLIRTGRIDAVLGNFAGKKWESYKALLPVPASEIDINRNITQNPGYGKVN
jgi:hypothetical protein